MNEQILNYVLDQLDDEVQEVEENCGAIWIKTESGKTYSILVTECEEDLD